MHPSCSASSMTPASRPETAACNSASATSPRPTRTTATKPAATRSGWSSAAKTPPLRRSWDEPMAACSDRAAASTSRSEETDMTTTAATNAASPIVSGTTPAPTSSSASGSGSTSNTTLGGNFQTFLTILTTKLQTQTPLDPLDTNQFTQQLVQFAGLEQQLKTNDQLTTLVSLQKTAQSTQALGFVGKNAMVDGSTTTMTNSSANWILGVKTNSTVNISIANSTGQTVFTGSYPVNAGDGQAFAWDGKGNDGTQWPDGKYTLTAQAADGSGNSVGVGTEGGGQVRAAGLAQSPPLLSINGQNYTVDQIKGIAG